MSRSKDRRHKQMRKTNKVIAEAATEVTLERWQKADPAVQAALLRRYEHPLVKPEENP